MKKVQWVIVILASLFTGGCNEPETVVTNTVFADGSVRRHVEMKGDRAFRDPELFRVPVDSTWSFEFSFDVGEDGDTIWTTEAEKFFTSADQISSGYAVSEDINSSGERSCSFSSSFRWFRTRYEFTERVEGVFETEITAEEFLSTDEMNFFMLPRWMREELLTGSDSLAYRNLADSLEISVNRWVESVVFHAFREEVKRLLREDEAGAAVLSRFDSVSGEAFSRLTPSLDFDSLLNDVGGEEFMARYGSYLDSSKTYIEGSLEPFVEFSEYALQTIMPGRVVESNGLQVAEGMYVWPVRAELFLGGDFIMSSVSEEVNRWAWYVTAGILLVVISVLIIRRRRP